MDPGAVSRLWMELILSAVGLAAEEGPKIAVRVTAQVAWILQSNVMFWTRTAPIQALPASIAYCTSIFAAP